MGEKNIESWSGTQKVGNSQNLKRKKRYQVRTGV